MIVLDTNTGLAPFFGVHHGTLHPLWDIEWDDTSFDLHAFAAHSKQWEGFFQAVSIFNLDKLLRRRIRQTRDGGMRDLPTDQLQEQETTRQGLETWQQKQVTTR